MNYWNAGAIVIMLVVATIPFLSNAYAQKSLPRVPSSLESDLTPEEVQILQLQARNDVAGMAIMAAILVSMLFIGIFVVVIKMVLNSA